MMEFGSHKNYYSRSHGSWVMQGQAGGKRTLNHQLQTLPSPATMLDNPIRKSIMEILKLSQFSTPPPHRCWVPTL